MHPDDTRPALTRLRDALGGDPRDPQGDRLGVARAQIELLNRQLDAGDEIDRLAFRLAMEDVFPELFDDDHDEDDAWQN